MTDSGIILIGAGIVVVAGIGLLVAYRQQESQKKQQIEDRQIKKEEESRIAKKEVNNILVDIKEELRKSAVSYYLDSHYRDYDLTESQTEELQKEYPPVLSRPSMDWEKIGYDSNIQEVLEKKLREINKDQSSTTSYGIKSTFEKESLEEAEQEAVEILKSMAEQKEVED